MKKFLPKGSLWLLLIALVLTLVAWLGTEWTDRLSQGARTLTTPVRSVAANIAEGLDAAYGYAFRYDELRAQVERLEEEIAQLERENRAGQRALAENQRLRALLGLRQAHEDFTYETAAVIGRTPTSWDCVLTIGVGSDAGVARDMCVVTQQGYLVGIITEVGPNWAEVTTLRSPEFSMGVRVEPSGECALLTDCTLSYLGSDAELTVGDTVVTSGLGENYPPGLTVGRVVETGLDPAGMEVYARVEPSVDLDELTQVFVIKTFDVVE